MTHFLALGNGVDGESIEAIPARLSGTRSTAAVGGVATFTDLRIDGSGAAFTLVGMAVGLTDDGECAVRHQLAMSGDEGMKCHLLFDGFRSVT